MQGGAIPANSSSTLTFDANISFTNNGHDTNEMNSNSHGSAIYLTFSSNFSLMPDTTVYWDNNHASLEGAIYVFDANTLVYCTKLKIATVIASEQCFFQLLGQNLSNSSDVQLVFKNNSADYAGSVLAIWWGNK